jgi:hypothetical protein
MSAHTCILARSSPCRFILSRAEGLAALPHFVPMVPLTAASRPARVPLGNSRMASSGQSSRGQFQIGKSSPRFRRLGGEALPLSPLATNHSPLTTVFPYSSHPVSRILAMFMKTKGIRISTRHTLARRSFVANHQSRVTNHTHSLAASFLEANGYSLQTGFPVTHSKQTTVVLSNRYDPTPWGEWRTGYCLALRSILLIATLRKPESP